MRACGFGRASIGLGTQAHSCAKHCSNMTSFEMGLAINEDRRAVLAKSQSEALRLSVLQFHVCLSEE